MNFRYIIIAVIIWSVLVGLSLTWNVIHHNEHIFDLAKNSAQANFNGGVGVAIPLQSYLDDSIDMLIMIWAGHGLVLLLGIITIIILFYFKSQQDAVVLKNLVLEKESFNAEKSNQIKSEFLSRMSHELRTPMNAILGFAQMLKLDHKDFNDIQNQNVSEIITASNYLMNLIDEVLDLSKIEAGKLDITMQQVIIVDLIQQITMLIQPLAQSRNIKVINELTDNEYVVMADVVRLKQVLMNFLSNAVKYNRDNGSVFIRGYVTDKQRLRINITDTGYGLSEQEIDKLFTPFERLDNVNNVEGTGIGLVISKHLVELMGGEIGVDSNKGVDCTFWIELDLIH